MREGGVGGGGGEVTWVVGQKDQRWLLGTN